MTIHDALEFYVHKSVSTQTVIDILEPAVSYVVSKDWQGNELVLPTIRADWHEGYRWGSVAEIERGENGTISYKRKLELPDKTKHTFVSDSLDDLVAQIEAFWQERNSSELDARVIEELDFEYDADEDEFVVPDHSNVGDAPATESVPQKTHVVTIEAKDLSPEVVSIMTGESSATEVIPEEEEMPPWLHEKSFVPTRLRLTLASMPTTKSWPAFQQFIKEHAGTATLVVVMPQGEVTLENVGLLPEHQAELRLIFGEATLKSDETESISAKVLEGLSL
jgi:hypothetical protein